MTTRSRPRYLAAALLALAGAAALVGCGAPATDGSVEPRRSESFPFDGPTLRVANDYADVDVVVGDNGTVRVEEFVTSVGTSPDEPAWSLTDGALDLGSTCGSTVGICQVSYRVTVPEGTDVELEETVEGAG